MKVSYWTSTGFKFFFSVMIFSYGIQLLMFYFVSDDPIIWNFSRPSFLFYFSLVYFTAFFVLFTLNAFKSNKLDLSSKLLLRFSIFLSKFLKLFWFKFRFIHVLLFLVSSIFWIKSGLANYRYDGEVVSDKLTPELLIGMLWKVFFFADFWFHISLVFLQKKKSKYKWKYLINISFLLTLTGTTSALYFLIHSLFVYFPNSFHKGLNISIIKTLTKRKYNILKYSIVLPALLIIPLIGYHYGEVIKTNEEISFSERFSESDSQDLIKLFFVQRFSTTFYGHTYLLDKVDYDFNDYIDHINIPFENFLYRLDVISGRGFNLNKPKIASINQLNYETILAFDHDKTSGASPGLIPGFMYLLNPWLAFIVAAFFLAKISILINHCIPKSTFFYSSLSLLVLLDLVKAAVLVFNPLDAVFFNLIFFLGLIGALYNIKKTKINKYL
jgi:hypothetical protein